MKPALPQSRRSAPAAGRALVGVCAAAVLLLSACSESEPEVDVDTLVLRERVAALFAEDRNEEARAALAPLLEVPDPEARDLLHAAILDLEVGDLDSARELLRRAKERAPELAAVHYVHGRTLEQLGELELALEPLQRAHELAPEDFPAQLALANVLNDLDRVEEAERHYRELLAADRNEWGNWMVSAAYRLYRMLLREGREDAGEVEARRQALLDAGFEVPGNADLLRGELGKIPYPAPRGTLASGGPPAAPAWTSSPGPAELAGAARLTALSLGMHWRIEEPLDTGGVSFASGPIGADDLVAWGPEGLSTARRAADGSWEVQRVLEEPVGGLWPIDFDDDGWLDFAYLGAGGLSFLRGGEGGPAPADPERPALPGRPSDAQAVDFDHDGDQDLLLAGAFGARLWRNDGLVVEGGAFADATETARLPRDTPFAWCLIEDFDADQDVDLLLGAADAAFLADNQRGGVFADRSSDLGGAAAAPLEPLAADLDADGLPDLWIAGEPGVFLRGRGDGPFAREAAPHAAPASPHPGSRALVDVDLDGSADAVWGSGSSLMALTSLGLPVERATELVTGVGDGGPFASAWSDLDGDCAVDLVTAAGGGVQVREAPSSSNAFRLALIGDKDNARGLGAVVEVRAGGIYRRIYWRGNTELIGIGAQPQADIVRVTWPNGVVQHEFDVQPCQDVAMLQKAGLAGSCPFLYTWSGETYEFVSDVLGITPLGLPMVPGQLVPPDHDEYVLVRGDQLVPRADADGLWYDLQITEELREVTYLDRAQLLVVDHPQGTELYPNERFSFPPFPERHEHVVREVHAPARAPGSDGRDWAPELAAVDGSYAAPFDHYRDQFQGLAPPYTLEVAFDPAAVPAEGRLRLLLTGWFLWTNASVNVAAARTPRIEFVPPILQVPAEPGSGGAWRETGPPIGFPAGKTKTMVVDVTGVLDRDDPRLRLFSTLALYWDSIRLAVGDDEPTRIAPLDPVSADLWERGFSRAVNPGGIYKLEWFEWDELLAQPAWNQHPGRYTPYGEVRPLLEAVDDRFCVMGSGDALRLRFDASAVGEPPAGWTRDYLLFLDGWAKDRDPNTVEALAVEPLPFHGMSGYPYGPGESFPDGEEHRRWRREWLTRPAKRWIEPLAPGVGAAR